MKKFKFRLQALWVLLCIQVSFAIAPFAVMFLSVIHFLTLMKDEALTWCELTRRCFLRFVDGNTDRNF